MITVDEPRPVIDHAAVISRMIEACREAIAEREADLCDLDRAIGDGDHGTNLRRGLDALAAESRQLATMPPADALMAAGTTLVMNIGGAAGPLYGTLLLELGAALRRTSNWPNALSQAVAAVARRGKSSTGEKTLLDVLYPLSDEVIRHTPLHLLAQHVQGFAEMTIDMKAMRGRASFLGERSIGHMDPGAASCALLAATICRELTEAGIE
ncbi:MAG TPA: dihydroxyacetone kinase subunit DhaL [Pararhizobium sp.]|uniref:dihydroxyacetone kinase subunit DhaL n=1 Tax=Pararhizobium sp. TaxID=1977563 RepID=UPI002C9F335D|nr:dihydroxyacetone kinase subunit DhaL [Pararhizobium sp.]HTO33772.1 dihydroxyacetone kinase subunit DhaL [Pararhizobium sp.]